MRLLMTGLVFAGISHPLRAQQTTEPFPSRPIRVVVPFSPGASDVQIRALAPHIAAQLGQPLVIENQPGGSGSIAAQRVKRAAADGYTLFYTGTATLTLVPASRADTGYSLGDFSPVANISTLTGVFIVNGTSPWRTLAELIEHARAHPSKLNYGSPGVGSAGHTFVIGPQAYGGFSMTHVPYKGGADVVQAVLSGSVEVGGVLPNLVAPHLANGRLRALAVTAPKRSEFLPEIPTYRELGIAYDDGESYGLVAPAGLPEAIATKVAAAVADAVKDAKFLETMRQSYVSVDFLSPPAYRDRLMARDSAWRAHLANPRFLEQLR